MKKRFPKSLLFCLSGLLSGTLFISGCESGSDSSSDTTEPGSLSFSSDVYSVMENGGSVTLTVNRVDGTAAGVTVDYETQQDSALEAADYQAASGTLTFDEGITAQVINITILDDSDTEGIESFTVVLSNPTGGATLDTPSGTTVDIIDDETTAVYTFELLNEGQINGQDNWLEPVTNAFVATDTSTVNGTQVVQPVVV